MAHDPALKITPEDVTGKDPISDIVQLAHDTWPRNLPATYGILPDEFVPMELFIARSPDCALEWICARTDQRKLMRAIRRVYDGLTEVDDDDDAQVDDMLIERSAAEDVASGNGSADDTVGKKRKRAVKEKSARAVNSALVKKLNMNLVQTVANTQDWENVQAPEGLSNEERRYRNFAKRLPGIGINAVTQMITKAVAVGSMDVVRDWQTIFMVWKRQNYYGKKLFQPVAVPLTSASTQGSFRLEGGAVGKDGALVVLSQHSDQHERDEAGLTALETETFRYKYFDAQKTQVDGIADEMRHRWKMDQLYEEYNRLEIEIKRRSKGTGARGIRYAGLAKEHLFASTYQMDLGRRATKVDDPDLWSTFGNYLDWGKRWNIIKKQFGTVGIFGLLPRGTVSNAFVEKTLTQTRVAQWAEMIAHCNCDVLEMAIQIEPLFNACMEETEPPPEFSFLEDLDRYTPVTRPLNLFLRESSEDASMSNDEHFYEAEEG